MKRKLLLILLALLPKVASAYDAYIGSIYYNLSGEEAEVTYKNTSYNSYTGSVIIPETITYNGKTYTVTSIGNDAFSDCSSLTSINIPEGVTSIGNYAFNECIALKSITIPESVDRIGNYAFYGCSNLKKVIVKDIASWCVIKFGSYTSNPLYYAHHLYRDDDTEITELVIPEGVTSIGRYAFYGCYGLTSIEIPKDVKEIGDSAFGGVNLKSVTCLGIRPPVIGINTFSEETYKNGTLYVPEGSENAYYAFSGWNKFYNIKTIGVPEKIPEDLNGDGIVDTQDVMKIYQYIQEH